MIDGWIVKRIRNQKGIKQRALGKSLGLSPQRISQLEQSGFEDSWAERLAEAMAVPLAALDVGNAAEVDKAQPLITRPLPFYGSVPAGPAWEPLPPTQEEYHVLAHLWGPSRYVMRVQGDSMTPVLMPGDLVVVERMQVGDAQAVMGKICVVRLNGDCTLKRMVPDLSRKGMAVLVPENQAKYEPQVVKKGEEVAIEGVVIEIVSRRVV